MTMRQEPLTDERLEAFLRRRAPEPDASLLEAVVRDASSARQARRQWLIGRRARLAPLVAAAVLAALVLGALAIFGTGRTQPPEATPPASPSASVVASQLTVLPATWSDAGKIPGIFGPGVFASRLPDGRVLVVGAQAAAFDPGGMVWTTAAAPLPGIGSMTPLANGFVLATGGGPDGRAAERFDPAVGKWQATGGFLVGRPSYDISYSQATGYTATLLEDGRVLVTGGFRAPFGSNIAVPEAELYDPVTGRWTATGQMRDARAYHTATMLTDGRVLVAGGQTVEGETATRIASAEIFDPESGTWTPTGSLIRAGTGQRAALLVDGRVLMAQQYDETQDTEIFDPEAGQWTAGASMPGAGFEQTATMLADGRILFSGGRLSGHGGKATTVAEIFDPAFDTWSLTAPLLSPRWGHAAVLLDDGLVLVVAGETDFLSMNWLDSAEIFDPGTRP